jgi:UDP-GlcNAc3NAcA epimerase
MKVTTIVGARPQFIKAAVVSRALAALGIDETIVHTGQHFDDRMSDVFFREMGIPAPAHNLGIGGLSHGAMTGRMLEGIESVIRADTPDWMLVYGDTNSTLAGALAAVKLHIRVAHVEAGLRSFNRAMPEEINRVLTDHASDLLFAPTRTAVANLRNEGIDAARIREVGDVMYDASIVFGRIADAQSRILETLGLEPGAYLLATVHRAENTDDAARLRAVFAGLAEASRHYPVVLPLHPRTRSMLAKAGIAVADRVRLIEPLGFLDMMMLEKHARLIATDSGGVQKEAYFHRVPCVTLRDETEWIELVEAGANRLAPPHDAPTIARAIEAGLATPASAFSGANLYGSGDAAAKIAGQLGQWQAASRKS